MNILIVKLSAIGDVIHTLPSLNAIRKALPGSRITWLVEEAAYPVIAGHKALDRIIVSRRKTWIKALKSGGRKSAIRESVKFIKDLRDTRYDLIIDFQMLLKSSVLAALARGNIKAGFGRGMDHMEHSYIFYNRRIPPVCMEIHALKRSLMMLEDIGIPNDEIVYDLPVSEADRREARRLLSGFHPGPASDSALIAINPMARWATKLWSESRFAALADLLVEKFGANVVFTGGFEDRDVISRIQSQMSAVSISLAGKTTLKTLAAVYEQAGALVSTDTGPMHLGAAVGIPVVALFGPTAPWRTGPYGDRHCVIRAGLDCSPCFKRRCPNVECMADIQVEDVIQGLANTGIIR